MTASYKTSAARSVSVRQTLRTLEVIATELLRTAGAIDQEVLNQPGEVAFPKLIFELPEDSSPAPDGSSREYLILAQELWQEAWSQSSSAPSVTLTAATARHLQQVVFEAHVVERQLLIMLEEQV